MTLTQSEINACKRRGWWGKSASEMLEIKARVNNRRLKLIALRDEYLNDKTTCMARVLGGLTTEELIENGAQFWQEYKDRILAMRDSIIAKHTLLQKIEDEWPIAGWGD
jgi:hypothetical protein